MQEHRMSLMTLLVLPPRSVFIAMLTVFQSNTFSSMSTQLKGSATRLGRMAASGNKVAIFKLAGIIVGVVIALWVLWGLLV